MFWAIKDFLKINKEQKEENTSLESEKGSVSRESQKDRLKLQIEIVDWEKKKKLVEAIIVNKDNDFHYNKEKYEREKDTFSSSKYFVIPWNIYGRIWGESWKLREYRQYDWKEIKFLFLPDTIIPPYDWVDERSKNFDEEFRKGQKKVYTFHHNKALEQNWYTWKIDEKDIYRVYKKDTNWEIQEIPKESEKYYELMLKISKALDNMNK